MFGPPRRGIVPHTQPSKVQSMRHRIYQTQALILRRSNIGEADRLLKICTPGGKCQVIARGTRKTSSRLAGHIELFTHTTLMLAVGRSLDVVTQTQTIQSFTRLRTDLARLSCAYYVAELYDAFTQEQEENHQLFALMVQIFRTLDTTSNLEIALRFHELQLLDNTGYRPNLHHCAVCQQQLTEEANRFSPTLGGVLCPQHTYTDAQALPMSLSAFKVLRHIQRQPFTALEPITLSADVRVEIEQLLRLYLQHILERRLKTVALFESLREAGPLPSAVDEPSTTHPLKELHHGIH